MRLIGAKTSVKLQLWFFRICNTHEPKWIQTYTEEIMKLDIAHSKWAECIKANHCFPGKTGKLFNMHVLLRVLTAIQNHALLLLLRYSYLHEVCMLHKNFKSFHTSKQKRVNPNFGWRVGHITNAWHAFLLHLISSTFYSLQTSCWIFFACLMSLM